mgnify:CR=1 FL=1
MRGTRPDAAAGRFAPAAGFVDNGAAVIIGAVAGVVGFIGEKSLRCLLRKIDQRVIALAVRRFAGREVEDERDASGIAETMKHVLIEKVDQLFRNMLWSMIPKRCRVSG